MNARPARALALLAACALPVSALANADHLLITEVGYDPNNSSESNEWFEIYNPTDVDVELNDGSTVYFVSDDDDAYWNVVNGPVTNSSSDWTLSFPPGAVLPARSFAVIVGDDVSWFAEFFPAGQAAFEDQPGNPQIFEFQTDSDAVPDMIVAGTGTSMSLTNSGEDLVIFAWDGSSDLVQDVDHVCWADLNELIDKTGVSLDGPDVDGSNSTYLPDAGGAVAAPDAPGGTSIQRIHGLEIGEVSTGGNGMTGHDETTEDWSASFVIALPTPGRFFLETDGDLADLAAAAAPLATSTADGAPIGATVDYGGDGTITELFAVPEDTDGDGLADILHIGVRGEFFTTTASTNGTFVGIDADPGSGLGFQFLEMVGSDGSDTTGTLDNQITNSGVVLGVDPFNAGIFFDAVLGFSEDLCPSSDVCGLRGFGTDGVGGLASDYAFLGDFTSLSDLAVGICQPLLPGGVGTVYAAPDGLEFAVPLADLGLPSVVALAAWTSADAGGPSPNTLPENTNNAIGTLETLEQVVCVGIDSDLPLTYVDLDGDGEGDPASGTPTCGLASGGVTNGDDCDDTDAAINTAAAETCDGLDEDCDGDVDEGFDGDSDGFVDGGDAACVATYGANVDCDDADAAINPSAAELCDMLDNDCDASVDEDFDGDGDGIPTNAVNDCITAYGPLGVDCDDTVATTGPGLPELCANGVDDDCDGATDAADPDCAAGDDDDSAGDDDDSAGDDDDSSGDDDDSAGDDDDSAGDDDDSSGDDDDSSGDDDDATGDDDDSAGDDDDSAGDDDDATGDDDDSAGDDDDATSDDDDATGDDDDATSDDDDSVSVGDDDDDTTTGCNCSTDGAQSPISAAWALLALGGALVRRRRPGYIRG